MFVDRITGSFLFLPLLLVNGRLKDGVLVSGRDPVDEEEVEWKEKSSLFCLSFFVRADEAGWEVDALDAERVRTKGRECLGGMTARLAVRPRLAGRGWWG